jgi:hypothetical protein
VVGVRDVRLDRWQAEDERFGDLAVGHAIARCFSHSLLGAVDASTAPLRRRRERAPAATARSTSPYPNNLRGRVGHRGPRSANGGRISAVQVIPENLELAIQLGPLRSCGLSTP